MSVKLVKGLVAVAALVLPAGSAFAYCQEGNVFTCTCPDGSEGIAYCVNAHVGPCHCRGGIAPVTEATPAEAPAQADEALVCEAPTPQPAPASASTQS
ncbi:hypothetical protein DRW03_31270 [Corallococcus sp. H22C18031201]|uniref:hypothetical protein n=1 Tax=Citreicoccus inhibens TaxID=2849499 RepID=UPI000E7409DA|nr:hypothetical protein [Citreicoccus inhibens]MBU8894413.1 hypothetical protein [Citreicoccus inhibens]RJS16124.1 hypothetical protein DRW03_31270 [Corallococcus sp. H22C18031201]